MNNIKSILLVGVGGQGTILVSKLLTQGLITAGYDVKMSEVHGMAQRGGSVSTQVRYGAKVFSPIIGLGQADVLVAFEQMEALRYATFIKPDGFVIINEHRIIPMPVAAGQAEYPNGAVEAMAANFRSVSVDAHKKAEEAGNIKSMNVVLLGTLIKVLKLEEIDWDEILQKTLPKKVVDVNIKALHSGLTYIAAPN